MRRCLRRAGEAEVSCHVFFNPRLTPWLPVDPFVQRGERRMSLLFIVLRVGANPPNHPGVEPRAPTPSPPRGGSGLSAVLSARLI